jgi:hypothetical protein
MFIGSPSVWKIQLAKVSMLAQSWGVKRSFDVDGLLLRGLQSA